MSMAVYDDADRIDDVPIEHPAAQPVFKPGRLASLWKAVALQLKIRARLFRRAVLVRIRNVFRIDEDFIRDELVDGLRRDLESATNALAQAVTGINALHERLEYHETNIPRMRTLRTQFDQGKRAEKKVQEEKVETAVREDTELTERHAIGLLR